MRRAVIVCSPEILREVLGPMEDHGLVVECSLESRFDQAGCPMVVLGISGDRLPVECAKEGELAREVAFELTKETYGRQSITRISAIRLTGRFIDDIARRTIPHAFATAA